MNKRKILLPLYKIGVSILKNSFLSKINFIQSIGEIIRKSVISDCIDVEGLKLYLYKNDDSSISTSDYEKDIVLLMKKFVKSGDTVLNLGSHVGFYVLHASKLVGPTGKVYGFEPNPENFDLLKKNVDVNKLENVILEQKAVSNRTGKTILNISNTSISHTLGPDINSIDSIEVEVVALDDYFSKSNNQINFVIMDVELHEQEVFEGMSQILQNEDIKIITEYFLSGYEELGLDPSKFPLYLTDLGFRLYDVFRKNMDVTDIITSKKIYKPQNNSLTSFFCTKEKIFLNL